MPSIFSILALTFVAAPALTFAAPLSQSNTCQDITSAGLPELSAGFNSNKDLFIGLCSANPTAPNLFPNDQGAAQKEKITDYCNYNLALRECIVCLTLSSKNEGSAIPIADAYDQCKQFRQDGEVDPPAFIQ
ncbi:hypothetical protein DL96DRAFT_1821627 [Flagelloscypha sp. PMI_526]|nr:hypothetical protein DL96DRAFT_1821627 [Flagelloscypha sp. PMI_526]